MKFLYCTLVLALTAVAGYGQKLMIGEKVPDLRVEEWYENRIPETAGRPMLLDFFHSANGQCVRSLPKTAELARKYAGKLNVIVLAREGLDKLSPHLEGKGYLLYAGNDESGKTFGAYGVRFVPFAVRPAARGRLVWTGNLTALTEETLQKAFK